MNRVQRMERVRKIERARSMERGRWIERVMMQGVKIEGVRMKG